MVTGDPAGPMWPGSVIERKCFYLLSTFKMVDFVFCLLLT